MLLGVHDRLHESTLQPLSGCPPNARAGRATAGRTTRAHPRTR